MPIDPIILKKSKNILNYLRDYLNNYINDTGVENISISHNEIFFTITFSLYNFFSVDIEYCNGIFEWYICNNDNLESLNNHKKYNAETELDIFVKDLLEILESKIPVKYLEYYKEKGFYTWKTFMD